jgi:hypothetical protein
MIFVLFWSICIISAIRIRLAVVFVMKRRLSIEIIRILLVYNIVPRWNIVIMVLQWLQLVQKQINGMI